MNCRKTRSLLSAYIDAELAGFEMLQIRDHMSYCSECCSEHESLVTMKRILGSLPDKDPRPEFVGHLQTMTPQCSLDEFFQRLVPVWVTNASSAVAAGSIPATGRRLATACLFSLVGVWFILAPTAMTPPSHVTAASNDRAGRLFHVVGFSGPYSLAGLRDASLSPIPVGPARREAMARDARLQLLQARLLAETRAESVSFITRQRIDSVFSSPLGPSRVFRSPDVVLAGYPMRGH